MKKTQVSIVGVVIIAIVASFFLFNQVSSSADCKIEGPCLLYFYSDDCLVCERMDPIVDELEKEYGRDLNIRRMDIESKQGRELARRFGVFGQPTFVLFDSSGEQTRKLAGAQTVETFEREIERVLGK